MSGHTNLPSEPMDLPLLPLRDVVVFPHMVIPLFVGRPKSIKALEAAMEAERRIMLVAQKDAAKDDSDRPLRADVSEVGTLESTPNTNARTVGSGSAAGGGPTPALFAKLPQLPPHFTPPGTRRTYSDSDGSSTEQITHRIPRHKH